MRTPAGSQGVSTVGDFWKNRAQFYFLKNCEISCHHPFKSVPDVWRIYQAICVKKKWSLGSAPRQRPIKAVKRWRKTGRGLQASHWGEPRFRQWSCLWRRYGRSSSQSFFHNTFDEIVDEKYNCAVACKRTVEVWARLIGTLRRCGGAGLTTAVRIADVTS